jgi:hypothetical protein
MPSRAPSTGGRQSATRLARRTKLVPPLLSAKETSRQVPICHGRTATHIGPRCEGLLAADVAMAIAADERLLAEMRKQRLDALLRTPVRVRACTGACGGAQWRRWERRRTSSSVSLLLDVPLQRRTQSITGAADLVAHHRVGHRPQHGLRLGALKESVRREVLARSPSLHCAPCLCIHAL